MLFDIQSVEFTRGVYDKPEQEFRDSAEANNGNPKDMHVHICFRA
jgi:hypothetical protein